MNKWQDNTGVRPVHDITKVDVLYKRGRTDKGFSALRFDWSIPCIFDKDLTIVKWRFHEDANDWIEHHGEECPVPVGTTLAVRSRQGEEYEYVIEDSSDLRSCLWRTSDNSDYDIVAFKFVVEPEAVQDESVNKVVDQFGDFDEKTKDLVKATPEEPVRDTNTNPKAQFGAAKLPLSLWPELATAYGCIALANGAFKYGKANFLGTPVLLSTYMDGLKRHIAGFMSGEEFDPVDGQPHLSGMLANIAIIITARAEGTLIDDRNIGSGYTKELEDLTKIFNNIKELHKDKNPFHYTLNNLNVEGK